MNRSIIITAIALIVLIGGVYLYTNSQNTPIGDHKTGELNKKSVVQSHRSYELEVTSSTDGILPNQPIKFEFKVKNDKGEVLKNYQTVHEKIMHLIVVRKDLQNFQHLHPDFNGETGEFNVEITFVTDGAYRIFPDFTPAYENPQNLVVTLNKDVDVGDASKYTPTQISADSSPTKSVDGYTITYKLDPDKPKVQENFTYTLTVTKNGRPVTDLQLYLGAFGHSVILRENTLDFIHTHAGDVMEHGAMMESSKGPEIKFSTTLPERGTYKLFTQFQHKNKVITTDFGLRVN